MDGMELTRLMKELLPLLLKVIEEDEVKSEDEIVIRVEAIKRELGAWFIDGCQIYQGS